MSSSSSPSPSLTGWFLCPAPSSSESSENGWTRRGLGASGLAERYDRGLAFVRDIQAPAIGTFVSEMGASVGQRVVLLGASALNAFSWFRLPSFNWTWVGGDRTVNNFYTTREGAEPAAPPREVVKETVTVVHDWSKADLSGLGDELKRELKTYVDGLMGDKERIWEEKSELSCRGESPPLGCLSGISFAANFEREEKKKVNPDLQLKVFLENNQLFVSELVSSVQRTLDLSDWEDKLKELRHQILETRGDLQEVKRKEELLMVHINEIIRQRVAEIVEIHLTAARKEEAAAAVSVEKTEVVRETATLANEEEVKRLIVGALKVYDADKVRD